MNNHTIAVYGTLRRGERANGMLDGASYLGERNVNGLMYRNNGGWFPFLVDAPEWMSFADVIVDVYTGVDDEQLRRMDQYEGYSENDTRLSLFVREETKTVDGLSVLVYKYNPEKFKGYECEDYSLIASGDWKNRKELKAA
jgi:gamma-glutamylcyclotransferase (GGCT)/AIG2-like uncharacterized protein YtfP